VKTVQLDRCRIIEYNDFLEATVVDSKTGTVLFKTSDKDAYARYRESKMLQLPQHAWFSFSELGVSREVEKGWPSTGLEVY
jgi:hypothetical protein